MNYTAAVGREVTNTIEVLFDTSALTISAGALVFRMDRLHVHDDTYRTWSIEQVDPDKLPDFDAVTFAAGRYVLRVASCCERSAIPTDKGREEWAEASIPLTVIFDVVARVEDFVPGLYRTVCKVLFPHSWNNTTTKRNVSPRTIARVAVRVQMDMEAE